MKLLSFYDFCALPDGVVYQEFKPMVVGDLRIRGKVYRNSNGQPIDFISCDPLAGPSRSHEHIEFPWGSTRWGEYDYDVQFIVYESHELAKLVGWLLAPERFAEECDDVISEVRV